MRTPNRKLIVVALTTAAILQVAVENSGALQLWPLRLTRALARSRQDSNMYINQERRISSSTTSTTTQTPPIELLFEMNPNDLDQRESQPIPSSQEVTLNGTLILEDLVNQFERNFNSIRATNRVESTNSTSKTISSTAESSFKSAKYKQAESQNQLEPTTSATVAINDNEFDQGENSTSSEDTLTDPYDDRHIQYDTITANSSIGSEELARPKSTDESRQASSLPLIVVPAISKAPKDTPSVTSPDEPASNLTGVFTSVNTSQAQARSMSGPSSRLPQHSRAPYASYNLFDNHRHGASVGQQPRETTPSPVPVAVPPPQTGVAEQLNQSRTTPSNKLADLNELEGRINKISTDLLAAELANQNNSMLVHAIRNATTTTTTPAPIKQASLMDRLQAYLNSADPNQTNGVEIERVVSKLAPINELIELEPLPAQREISKTPVSERQFLNAFVGPHRAISFNSPVGKFSEHRDAPRDPPVLNNNSLKSVVGELLADEHHSAATETTAMLPQMETIEMLSNLVGSSDSSLLATGSSNTMAVHQHRERSPPQHLAMSQALNRGELNGGNPAGGTFAASLINVTAPMVLPLSASEAMEAALAAQQQPSIYAKSNNQQTGGHPLNSQRVTAQPHRASFHVAPPTPARNSIYMRPANSLRPSGSVAPSSQLISGFRSPLNQFSQMLSASGLPTPSSYLNGLEAASSAASVSSTTSTSTVASTDGAKDPSSTPPTPSSGSPTNKDSLAKANSTTTWHQQQQPATTNGFITGTVVNTTLQPSPQDLLNAVTGGPPVSSPPASGMPGSLSTQMIVGGGGVGPADSQLSSPPKRAFNLSRVEHISAECSNDLIRTVIVFNGTFKGIIYSSNYVRDPNCLYVNGTGKTRYDFSIRLNQCGTIGRQELHQPTGPDEVRRRDQVMWNSLSIQYNPMIEQEWDEHFRVSCEYGSDFWKTISFNPFNVETNTGAPVVFTVDPPQCQMEILKGHGMVGPRQEAVTGPVTVGDPLTLLIHMKSEKAGYDILVKNCVAHNGGQQRMQLIDSNGCVINERFISPFRGTYNDNELKHVTLYSYLKAFRFTGSPVLYLECEVHMCQSACPPQMCYWRRLSKRSLGNETSGHLLEQDFESAVHSNYNSSSLVRRNMRTGRRLESDDQKSRPNEGNLSDKVSLFQALEVRQERLDSDEFQTAAATSSSRARHRDLEDNSEQLMCYQRVEIFAFLFAASSILLAAISVAVGCCWRAASLRRKSLAKQTESGSRRHHAYKQARNFIGPLRSSIESANLCYSPMSPLSTSSSSISSLSPPLISPVAKLRQGKHQASPCRIQPASRPRVSPKIGALPWLGSVGHRAEDQAAQYKFSVNQHQARATLASQQLVRPLDERLLVAKAAKDRN